MPDLGDDGADGSSLKVYQPKKKDNKFKVNTAKVGNQLKLCNTRSCIKFYFRNLGLHPKKYFLLPCVAKLII